MRRGEIKDLCTIFEQTVHKTPPAGAGECALPKLLQYAYLHQLKAIGNGRVLVGKLSEDGGPASRLLLPLVQRKMRTDSATHAARTEGRRESTLAPCPRRKEELEIVFEDEWLVVVNKPSGMLCSVPGKEEETDSRLPPCKSQMSGSYRADDRTPAGHGNFRVVTGRQN